MKKFGLDRVVEPKEAVPVTAWKLDNSMEIGPEEIRVRLEMIHIEWDNFNQLCSHCGHDETRIKARILQIVNERGKFHNPYTGSGGIFIGTVEAVGAEAEGKRFAIGDRVVSLSTMTGVPVHIDSIGNIDYSYGQMVCTGYAICFDSTMIEKVAEEEDGRYLMSALDEGGNFYSVHNRFKHEGVKRVAIIGGNCITTLFYAQTVFESCSTEGELAEISVVMDREILLNFSENELKDIFKGITDKVFVADLSTPMEAFDAVTSDGTENINQDAVINLSDVPGSETLVVLLLKERGIVFYTSLMESYSTGILIADSMGKEIIPFAMDGYSADVYDYAVKLIERIKPNLAEIDKYIKKKGHISYDIKGEDSIHKIVEAVDKMEDFIYRSPVTKAMLDEALNVAKYDCNIIIQGETGVGKEKVFNLIHQNSPRQGKPCIKINCATIHENLAESEFFGYEKGSFTGAQATGKAGYFEMANNGTLFLDEIGSLSISMQSKLLRVLQENSYYRVGGTEQKHVNVRVICANNVPIRELVKEGLFREDLYYRLNICDINVPPLRKRREDIVVLSLAFIKNYSKKYGVEKEISPEALKLLEMYDWPGNVRELENVIHRLYISERDRIVGPDSVNSLIGNEEYEKLIVNISREAQDVESIDFNAVIDEQERRLISYALEKAGTTRKAAEFLNIPQATFARKKVKYNL